MLFNGAGVDWPYCHIARCANGTLIICPNRGLFSGRLALVQNHKKVKVPKC